MYLTVIAGLILVIASLALTDSPYPIASPLMMIIGLAVMRYGYNKAKDKD